MSFKKTIMLVLAGSLFLGSSVVLATPEEDQRIKMNLGMKLTSENLPTQNITWTVQDGVVTLNGIVENALQKEAFRNAAESISGVIRVDSNIVLRGNTHN